LSWCFIIYIGAHECKGAAAILNKNPIKIKIAPKLTPLLYDMDMDMNHLLKAVII